MMRREFLATAPASFAAMHALPVHEQRSEVFKAFERWSELHDEAGEPQIPEEEFEKRMEQVREQEQRLMRMPIASPRDLALKILVDGGFGSFQLSEQIWAELCSVAQLPPERLFA